jgi:DNA-binding response OmpR family regulator
MLGPTFACSVVVVDSDHTARRRLMEGLAAEGLGAAGTAAGLAGVEQAMQEPCDALVAAVPLSDLTTRQFLGMARAVGDFPILILGARPGEVAVVLDAGADDAVEGRPSAREVAARVRALRRRSRPASDEDPIQVGRLVVDPARREARLHGRALDLTRREFDLLHALARRRGRVATRRDLLAEVWAEPLGGPDKTLDVHLSWLRRKLGESGTVPRYLHTIRGVGVKLIDPEA